MIYVLATEFRVPYVGAALLIRTAVGELCCGGQTPHIARGPLGFVGGTQGRRGQFLGRESAVAVMMEPDRPLPATDRV
jgi:hypothetical protein